MNAANDTPFASPKAELAFISAHFKSRTMEHAFRQHHLQEDKKRAIAIMTIAIIFVLFFLAADLRLLLNTGVVDGMLVVRSGFVLLTLAVIYLVMSSANEKWMDALVFVSVLSLCGVQISIHLLMPWGYGAPILFNIMIIMIIYIILAAPLMHQLIPALLLSTDIIVLLIPAATMDHGAILVALLCSNLIGIVFSRQSHKNRRLQFSMWQNEIELKNALKENGETLHAILSASPVAICRVENSLLKWANEAFLTMFGLASEADYMGRNMRLCYANDDEFHRAGDTIYEKLQSGKAAEEDVRLKRSDDSTFTGHIKMSWHDPADPKARAIMTISDISWRKQVETDHLKKEKLQSVIETAGAVCHELNQPLQTISGYAELSLMDMTNDHPLYHAMQTIKTQVARMRNITQQLMGITRYKTMDYLDGKIIDIDQSAG